jgi:hypothetical protein
LVDCSFSSTGFFSRSIFHLKPSARHSIDRSGAPANFFAMDACPHRRSRKSTRLRCEEDVRKCREPLASIFEAGRPSPDARPNFRVVACAGKGWTGVACSSINARNVCELRWPEHHR